VRRRGHGAMAFEQGERVGARESVFGQRSGQEVPVLVIDRLLEEGLSDSLP
jgi:hypothetical protein